MESATMLMDGQFPTGIFLPLLTAAMVAVIVLDTTRYIIPNMLNLALLVLYVFAAFALDLNWPMALLAAAIVLLVGLGFFALGLMGGGDVKLIVVLSLWTGWGIATLNFIMLTAVTGGVLVIVVLLTRFFLPPFWTKLRPGKNLPRILTAKEPVPYGIAIAAAFVLMLWTNSVPGITV